MINDFLDNLAAHQYQKMHQKKKKREETIDDMAMIDDQYAHHFHNYDERLQLSIKALVHTCSLPVCLSFPSCDNIFIWYII